MNPDNNSSIPTGMSPQLTPPNKNKTILWIALGAALVIVAIIVLVMVLMPKQSDQKSNNTQNNGQDATVDLNTLTGVTLEPPAEMPGYTVGPSVGSQKQYVKDLGGGGSSCRFSFGTPTTTDIPGDNPQDIATKYVGRQSQNGGQIITPVSEGEQLLVKSKDGKTTYKLPTYNATIKFTSGTKEATTYIRLSLAVLKNGDRVMISRSCQDTNDLIELDKLVVQLTVEPKQ